MLFAAHRLQVTVAQGLTTNGGKIVWRVLKYLHAVEQIFEKATKDSGISRFCHARDERYGGGQAENAYFPIFRAEDY